MVVAILSKSSNKTEKLMHNELKESYQKIITAVGEDAEREGLLDTSSKRSVLSHITSL